MKIALRICILAYQLILIIKIFWPMKKEMFDTIDGKILRAFQIVKKIGQGAYGQVWKVKDKKTSAICALKKIYDAFRNSTDAQRAYRQIKYLQKLNHPNIIKILSFFKPENTRDIYITLQFMEADLSTAIRNNVLREIHKHFIFFQIVQAVNYIHSAQLIHRDLKPSNILINENCQVKLCDFGLIRSLVPNQGHSRVILTENIATRWYRAPQILLCSNSYGKQIDIWSLGCILAEIFLGRPLFQGSSSISQLEKIFEITGKPCRQQLTFIKSEASRSIVESMTATKKRSISDIFYRADPHLIDLLQKIFQVNPKKRITIEQIVKHPFVSRFKGRTEQRKVNEPIRIKHESEILNAQQYRMLLYNELDEKPHSFQLNNTCKMSETSTFYESSITYSLPNNSRQHFFAANCQLGRLERPSPERLNNKQHKFTPVPSFQSLQQFKKTEQQNKLKKTWKRPIDNIQKFNSQLNIQRTINFPIRAQDNHLFLKDRSEERPKISKTPELNIKRTNTPIKAYEHSPVARNYSNQKPGNYRKNGDISPLKTPVKFITSDHFLKVPKGPQETLIKITNQRRGSPSPQNIKNQTSFDPNRTMGPGRLGQQLKKEKIVVPKFILEGRKKLRSGSPNLLLQNTQEENSNKKQAKFHLLQSPNNTTPKNTQTTKPSFQFQQHLFSPLNRQSRKPQIISPNGLK